jgi:hypothetical protein
MGRWKVVGDFSAIRDRRRTFKHDRVVVGLVLRPSEGVIG